ncbi:hypothetical protein ACFSKM_07970 [Ancylobacter dichloromethanicus]
MAKLTIRIPNVSWREGRPRFNPGPKLRKLGYRGEDLRHPGGAWFTPQEAAEWAQARADEVAGRRRAKAQTGRLPALRRPRHQTLQGLADEWFESPKFKGGTVKGKRVEAGLSPVTSADYKGKLASLWKYDPALGQEPPPAITPQLAQAIFDRMWEDRGLAAARSAVAVLSSLWKWAKARGRGGISINPWIGLEKPMLEPRLCVWEDHEIAAMVAAADAWARPEIGDAVLFGLFTGQRQNDRLAYERAGTDDAKRLVFRQSKTGAIVAIPATPQLAARLEAAERRRFFPNRLSAGRRARSRRQRRTHAPVASSSWTRPPAAPSCATGTSMYSPGCARSPRAAWSRMTTAPCASARKGRTAARTGGCSPAPRSPPSATRTCATPP